MREVNGHENYKRKWKLGKVDEALRRMKQKENKKMRKGETEKGEKWKKKFYSSNGKRAHVKTS